MPQKIIFDQDKVFLVKKNLGDLIYTVPTGTYHGYQTLVYLEEKEGQLHILAMIRGKPLPVTR